MTNVREVVDAGGGKPVIFFPADVVELEGRPAAKAGRELRPNPRLREAE